LSIICSVDQPLKPRPILAKQQLKSEGRLLTHWLRKAFHLDRCQLLHRVDQPIQIYQMRRIRNILLEQAVWGLIHSHMITSVRSQDNRLIPISSTMLHQLRVEAGHQVLIRRLFCPAPSYEAVATAYMNFKSDKTGYQVSMRQRG